MNSDERKAALLAAAAAVSEIEQELGSDRLYDMLGITASTISDALETLAENIENET